MPEPVEHPPHPDVRVDAHDPAWKAAQVAARRADEAEPEPEPAPARSRGRHEKDIPDDE